ATGRLRKPSSTCLINPRIGPEIIESPDDAIVDRNFRRPAQTSDLRAVEEDERTVTDPTALAAGVRQTRRDAETLRNPANGLIHFAILVGTKVVDVNAGHRILHRQKDRVDAVLNVEVGLALPAVAENTELGWIVAKAAVEIENVPVRVALAENRDEAEDVALEPVAFAVGLDQAFTSELRGAVERRLNRERHVLGSRNLTRLTIDRACRRKGNALDTSGAHGLEHIERGDRILLEVSLRMIETETDVGVGRKVKYDIT